MTQRPPWGITSQYLTFFILTSVLPIVVICLLFFKSGNDKLNERMNNELNLGISIAESVYENDMKRLALATEQAAQFSIGREYIRMESSRNKAELRSLVDSYRELKQLDIVTVFDSPKGVEARSGFISYKLADSYNRIIKDAFNGETVATVEAFQDDATGSIFLAYLSAAPIPDPHNPKYPAGVLVTGRSVSNEYSFHQLLKMLPELDVRIVMKVDDHLYEVLSSSDSVLKDIAPEEEGLIQSGISRLQGGASSTFQEEVNGQQYKSKAAPLMDYSGAPIGYIIVSTSEEDFKTLRTNNITFIALYLFIGLGIVGYTGLWFRKVFVKPVDDLSQTFNEVANGNLEVRVQDDVPQAEMKNMLTGFNTMIKQLRETERLRDTFISSLTHDLRTPVTAQKRVLETLNEMKDELDPEVVKITKGLLKNNEQLLDMINKLLEASQYEAGSIRLSPETTNLHKMVALCCNEMRPIAETKISLPIFRTLWWTLPNYTACLLTLYTMRLKI